MKIVGTVLVKTRSVKETFYADKGFPDVPKRPRKVLTVAEKVKLLDMIVICEKTLIFLFLNHILGQKRSLIFCFILQFSIVRHLHCKITLKK